MKWRRTGPARGRDGGGRHDVARGPEPTALSPTPSLPPRETYGHSQQSIVCCGATPRPGALPPHTVPVATSFHPWVPPSRRGWVFRKTPRSPSPFLTSDLILGPGPRGASPQGVPRGWARLSERGSYVRGRRVRAKKPNKSLSN